MYIYYYYKFYGDHLVDPIGTNNYLLSKMEKGYYKDTPIVLAPCTEFYRGHGGSFSTRNFKVFNYETGGIIQLKEGEYISLENKLEISI